MTKLESQYNEVKKAFEKLGLDCPKLEDFKDKLSKEQKSAITKGKGQLVISPEINKDFTFFDLLDRYKKHYDLYVYEPLWRQYEKDLYGVTSVNVIDLIVGNKYDDPVTQGTNKTIDEQRKLKGQFMNPVEAVVLNTMLKEKGENLAPNSFIRFPQLESKTVDGVSIVGDVHSVGGRLDLDGGGGGARPSGGVGFSVGQSIPLNLKSSSLPLSSKQSLTDYLLDKGHTINKALVDDIVEFYDE